MGTGRPAVEKTHRLQTVLATARRFTEQGGAFDRKAVTQQVTTKVPVLLLRHPIREYQHVGLHWLATLHEKHFNGILADEMGLGKTVQTIALLAHLAVEKETWGPHLIVAPTSVLLNWEMELKKWAPGLKVLAYYGSSGERREKRRGWNVEDAFHVCVASYASVLADLAAFKRKRWCYMILDEAQHIKNFKSLKWQHLIRFSTEHRLLLTGTPLQNDLMELWSLMHFLMPDIFDSYDDFKAWFSDPLSMAIQTNNVDKECGLVARLHEVIRPFMLRRVKSEVERQMPSKSEYVVKAIMSRRQQVLYDEFIRRKETQSILKSGDYMSMMGILLQLRKVCNHPELFEPRYAATPFTMFPLKMSVPGLILLGLWESVGGRLPGEGNFCSLLLPLISLAFYERKHLRASSVSSLPPLAASICLGAMDVCPTFRSQPKRRRISQAPSFSLVGLPADEHASTRAVDFFAEARRQMERAAAESKRDRRVAALAVDLLVWESCKGRPWFGTDGLELLTLSCSEGDWVGTPLSRVRTLRSAARRSGCQVAREDTDKAGIVISTSSSSVQRSDWRRQKNRRAWSDVATSVTTLCRCVQIELEANARSMLGQWVLRTPKAQVIPLHPSRYVISIDELPRKVAPASVHSVDIFATPGLHVDFTPQFRNGVPARWQRMRSLEVIAYHEACRASSSPVAAVHSVMPRFRCLLPEKHYLESDCGKLARLRVMLHDFKSRGWKCIIFTQFSKMLDVLESFVNHHRLTYLRLDGSVKVERRQWLVDRFNADGRIFLFLASTRSGGVGINLTGANVVIFYDSDWNPAMDRQAMDRAHRIGQTRDVYIYRLITQHTVEENIWKRQLQKRLLDDVVVDQGRFNTSTLLETRSVNEDSTWTAAAVRSMLQEDRLSEQVSEHVAGRGSVAPAAHGALWGASEFESMLLRVEESEDVVLAQAAGVELALSGGTPTHDIEEVPGTSETAAAGMHDDSTNAWLDKFPPLICWGVKCVQLQDSAVDAAASGPPAYRRAFKSHHRKGHCSAKAPVTATSR
eukprot:TRINITY_DN25542_c0_g1_i1.p1 TRINITY_DN25542_c0_g1~~TRINITY_DN25542_c0_g1_i1.p1  ORF type:complete len:1106 (-),score=137.80 TRINITY_DN25542_c0_g1_i1:262-3360(-)